ncbi:hypothetical protein NAT51_02900 [Flavobacterium amniphilum]|uniref:hypothetical protein n=1 Tax=Flavobacterium amniphilum TaxID=1834035 RepID=UPI00202ABF7A|nr:hypothetical protein [Flavobacterium amniphilum]MCL9804453.1 hypothetical protein [Flavobacterium amniphilum]
MIPGYYTLIAALLGGALTLAGQYLSSFLTSNRDKKKMKMELIAEERFLAYLLSQYYALYIQEITHSAYFLRLAAIAFEFDKNVDNEELYKSANESLSILQEFDEKIRLANANYFKVITYFTNLTKKRKIIISLFNDLRDFVEPKFSFEKCRNVIELNEAREKEKKRLTEAYSYFPNTYNRISEEMKKSV